MYKVTLYSNDGKFMQEWIAKTYECVWDYKAVELTMSKKVLGDRSNWIEEEYSIVVKGEIIIIEGIDD